MKAITLWQPWASLLACGAKELETRPWNTNYRGKIAIHAAAKSPNLDTLMEFSKVLRIIGRVNEHLGCYPGELPRGAVIATAELIGSHEISYDKVSGRLAITCIDEQLQDYQDYDIKIFPSYDELLLGDWSPGRYAWEFANMTMLPEPISVKGKQGLWTWGD